MSLSILSYVFTRITLNSSRVSKYIIICKDIVFKKKQTFNLKKIIFYRPRRLNK
jgi:hypothetical protein